MAPKLLLTAVLGCVALGTSASSKSTSHELINTPYGGDNIGELPLFNPALGHLDSIDIDIFGFSSQLFDVDTMEEPSTLYMTLEGASVVFEYGGISLTASMPKVSKVYHYQPWAGLTRICIQRLRHRRITFLDLLHLRVQARYLRHRSYLLVMFLTHTKAGILTSRIATIAWTHARLHG